jgi:RNA polymerase sigma factor (sigma-70 family)
MEKEPMTPHAHPRPEPQPPDAPPPEETDAGEPNPRADLTAIAAHGSYRRLIRKILWQRNVDQDDIEDVQQNVFLSLFKYLPSAGKVRSMPALISTLCACRAADYHRSRARRGRVRWDHEDVADAAPGAGQGPLPPDRAAVVAEECRIVRAAVERMAPEQRDVFVSIHIEENTAPATAAALGLRLPTVKGRIHAARRKLAEVRAPFLDEEERSSTCVVRTD